MSKIVIAVPRGRITKECKNLLLKTSFAPDPLLFDKDTRKLTFKSKKEILNISKLELLKHALSLLLEQHK